MPAISNILRRGDPGFFDLFQQAGANNVRAAELLAEMLGALPDTHGLAQEILDCEHVGDRITHEVIRRLNRADLTPIDRKDILELSSALDDIVDFIEEVADYLGLYRIEAPMAQAQELARVLLDATRALAAAIPLIRGLQDISHHVVEVRRLENEGDRIVRGAIASLFETGINPIVVICWKDIFERLENAIDSTERGANTLDGIGIKNSLSS